MKTNVYSSESEMESIVPVTTDREAHPERWVAALVHMCTEKKVGDRLKKLGIENYVPTQTEIHQWSDRKKKVERIVIPMVIFIHTDSATEKRLITYSFIHKLLYSHFDFFFRQFIKSLGHDCIKPHHSIGKAS